MAKETDIGTILLNQGILNRDQLAMARRRAARQKIALARAITDLNLASEEETYRALAELHGLEFVEPEKLTVDRSVRDMAPIKLVLHYRFVPIRFDGGVLTLAFSEPPPLSEMGNLRLLLGHRIRVALATPSGIHAFIKRNYGLGAETIQHLRQEEDQYTDLREEITFDVETPDEPGELDASISRFVNQILMEALRLEATDIHIEPYVTRIRLRYRIDGVLQDIPVPPGLRQLYPAIISRLKVMAGLNITEKRVPHDGRISMKTGTEEYDLRVSIIPTTFGEGVCLRILGRETMFLDLEQLGMEPEQQRIVEELTRLPQGMVLLTGPTGSGKTTTLYAILAHANDEDRKIVTIENPVEYKLEGISQIQIRPEVGLDFSNCLRSVLRHDPDVILIGEIRDQETAEIAIRSAQTGHLVFSTLHTNDSVSAVTRLLEMKVEPFLIGSSLVCSIAQRLARRVCRHCMREAAEIPDSIRREMAAVLDIAPDEVRAWEGTGCVECNENGYRGRVALYEFFVLDEEIMDALSPGVKTGELRRMAKGRGWRSLREQGWIKVQNGIISIDENQRLTRSLKFRIPKDSI